MRDIRYHPEDNTLPFRISPAPYVELREYRPAIASFAILIGGSLIFLWISWGTQLHQLAIGIGMSSITLALALALFEVCWQVGERVAERIGSERKD